MIIEVTADFDNGETQPLFIQISWNGEWSDDTLKMQNNLVVKNVEKKLLTSGLT